MADESDIIALAKYTKEVLEVAIAAESGGPDVTVERRWSKKDSDKNLETMTGRHVDVWHTTYADNGPATREEGFFSVTLAIVISERYELKQQIPDEWIDDLVNWVEQYVFNVLGTVEERTLEGSTSNPLRLGQWWTQSIVMAVVCDAELLRTQKVFWSEIELTFTRLKA